MNREKPTHCSIQCKPSQCTSPVCCLPALYPSSQVKLTVKASIGMTVLQKPPTHTHKHTHSILTGLRLSMSESHVSMMRVSFGHEPNVHSFLSFETSVQRFCRAFNYNWCKTVLKWCAHREGLRNKRTKIKL